MKTRIPVSVRRRSGYCPCEHRGAAQIFGMAHVMERLRLADIAEQSNSQWRRGVTMKPGHGNITSTPK